MNKLQNSTISHLPANCFIFCFLLLFFISIFLIFIIILASRKQHMYMGMGLQSYKVNVMNVRNAVYLWKLFPRNESHWMWCIVWDLICAWCWICMWCMSWKPTERFGWMQINLIAFHSIKCCDCMVNRRVEWKRCQKGLIYIYIYLAWYYRVLHTLSICFCLRINMSQNRFEISWNITLKYCRVWNGEFAFDSNKSNGSIMNDCNKLVNHVCVCNVKTNETKKKNMTKPKQKWRKTKILQNMFGINIFYLSECRRFVNKIERNAPFPRRTKFLSFHRIYSNGLYLEDTTNK